MNTALELQEPTLEVVPMSIVPKELTLEQQKRKQELEELALKEQKREDELCLLLCEGVGCSEEYAEICRGITGS